MNFNFKAKINAKIKVTHFPNISISISKIQILKYTQQKQIWDWKKSNIVFSAQNWRRFIYI